MSSSTPVVEAPTKVMPWEEFYVATENADKLMDRVWYCIAATEEDIGNQKVFWEHWFWDNDEEKSKEVSPTTAKSASNHTYTTDVSEKTMDYPVWPVTFTKESFKMYPAIDCKCFIVAPLGLPMQPVVFPEKDSRKQFRVDYCSIFGKKLYFIFCLDPHISKEDQDKEYAKLAEEYGVKREWFHSVQWSDDYVIGSTGEPDINPKE